MSDDWIVLIPEKAGTIPDESRRHAALKRLYEIAPDADEIELKLFEKMAFFESGSNFTLVKCPDCGKEISIDWWQEKMDAD